MVQQNMHTTHVTTVDKAYGSWANNAMVSLNMM